MRPKACNYQTGWILGTATTMKVFIDIFIGIWAFVLGYIWTNHINVTPTGQGEGRGNLGALPEIHLRLRDHLRCRLYLALGTPADIAKKVPAAIGEANIFRVHLLHSDLLLDRRAVELQTLWQEGFGKLAAVYVVSLFGFVIWVGLLISWIFFGGVTPPLAS